LSVIQENDPQEFFIFLFESHVDLRDFLIQVSHNSLAISDIIFIFHRVFLCRIDQNNKANPVNNFKFGPVVVKIIRKEKKFVVLLMTAVFHVVCDAFVYLWVFLDFLLVDWVILRAE